MKLQELIKMKKKLQKVHLTYYNLMMAQDLWKSHYQILSKVFLRELIKLNLNMDIMIKNVELAELHMNYATVFLNTQILNMI